jgi:predicted nucleotidyltransferase
MSNDAKSLILSEKYAFLRENEHIKDKIILLTLGGSHAYGTNTETSDLDIRGIVSNSKNDLLGLSNFEYFVDTETDTTIYSVKKTFLELMQCNPNTIEIIGTREEDVLLSSDAGKLIRSNFRLFLSKRAVKTFSGYATAQLRRIQNNLARHDYPQEEKEIHILKNLERQMHHFKEHYKSMEQGYIKLNIGQGKSQGYDKEILMDINLEQYPLRGFAGIYSEMTNVIRDYDKLNHRNKKKTDLGLNKHKMHLIRLFYKGIEVLAEEKIETHCGYLVPELMKIRNGHLSDEEFFILVEKLEKDFDYAAKHTNLPDLPNNNKIEELLVEINLIYLRNNLN